MANPIKKKDIYEGGDPFKEVTDSLKKLIVSEDLLIKKSNELKATMKGDSTQNQIVANKELAKTNNELLKIENDKQKLIRQAITEAAKMAKAENDLTRAKELGNKVSRDENILADKNAGTMKKMAAEARILKRERDGLNLSTDNGKKRLQEINSKLDENTKFLKANSDALTRARMNVGNYTASIKEAVGGVRIFGTSLGDIGSTLKSFITNPFLGIAAGAALLGSELAKFSNIKKILDQTKSYFDGFMVGMMSALQPLTVGIVDFFNNIDGGGKKILSFFGENLINRVKAVGFIIYDVFNLKKLFSNPAQYMKNLLDDTIMLTTGFEGLLEKGLEVGAIFAKLKKEEQLLKIERQKTEIKSQEAEIKIAQLRAKLRSKNKEEAIAAGEEAKKLIIEQYNDDVLIANKELDLVRRKEKELRKYGKLGKAISDEEMQALTKVNDLKLRAYGLQAKIDVLLQNKEIALNIESLANAERAEKEVEDARKVSEAKAKELWDYLQEVKKVNIKLEEERDRKIKEDEDAMLAQSQNEFEIFMKGQDAVKRDDKKTANQKINDEIAELKRLKNATYIEESDYNAKLGDLGREKMANDVNAAADAAQKLNELMASYDQSRMDKELLAAGDNEANKEQIRKKYAKRKQIMDIAQATIDGARAVVAAMLGSPYPMPAQIFMAIAAATAAAQIGIIASQKFEKGGYGVLGGRRHSQGGTYIDGVGEGEQGEGIAIFSRDTTARYGDKLGDLTSMINSNKIDPFNLNFKQNPLILMNDFGRLVKASERHIDEQKKTNLLLSKTREISPDGKSYRDIDGNILRYV